MKDLKKDVMWVFSIVMLLAIVAVIYTIVLRGVNPSNDTRVIGQFIYKQFNECNEKLAAYGEDVDLNIPKYKVSGEDLTTCLEKLGAYGEDIRVPLIER